MSTTQQLINQTERLFRHNRQGSYQTRRRYAEAFRRFCRFLGDEYHLTKLKNIAPKHLHAYVQDMQQRDLSPSTIKTDIAAIRFWHDQIPDTRYKLPPNSELNLERRSFSGVDRTWSEREFNRFLVICELHNGADYLAIASLARYVGLRIHECFRIDTAIASRTVRNREITIKGKGGKIRTMPLDDVCIKRITDVLSVTPFGQKLFVRADEPTHAAINRFQDFIREHRDEFRDEDNDFPLTFHGLRHSYAVEQYLKRTMKKSDIMSKIEVSELLGHNRSDVTNIYLASVKLKQHDDNDGGSNIV